MRDVNVCTFACMHCIFFCIAFTWIRKLVLVVCVWVIAYLGTGVCALLDANIWFGSARVLISKTGLSYSTNAVGMATTTISAEIGNVFHVYLRACVIAFARN